MVVNMKKKNMLEMSKGGDEYSKAKIIHLTWQTLYSFLHFRHFELTRGAHVGNLGLNRAHISELHLSLMNLMNKITF